MSIDGLAIYLHFLTLAAPNNWPETLAGAPRALPLAIGLGCFWLWCFAILPRRWYGRHGWSRALGLFATRLLRSMLYAPFNCVRW